MQKFSVPSEFSLPSVPRTFDEFLKILTQAAGADEVGRHFTELIARAKPTTRLWQVGMGVQADVDCLLFGVDGKLSHIGLNSLRFGPSDTLQDLQKRARELAANLIRDMRTKVRKRKENEKKLG